METKELVTIVEENGLEKTQGQFILDSFTGFIKQATEWEVKAKSIVIKDVSQIEEMAKAREARLALKGIRVEAENTRKSLKEKALREGKAIDGVANVIKALIVPLEEYLEAQEKFAENIEKERKDKINAEREMKLQKYVEDVSLYNFKEMSDEAFEKLLHGVKVAWEAEQEVIKKAEQERIENEKKEAEEREKQRLENIKLKQEAEAREKELAKERAEQEKKLEAEKLKAKKEVEAREKIEAQLKAKKEAEEKAIKEKEAKEQAEKLAKLEAEKKAELAPDREKLNAYAVELGTLAVPKLETKEAKETLSKALKLLGEVVALLKTN
jgi:hypothetical protein